MTRRGRRPPTQEPPWQHMQAAEFKGDKDDPLRKMLESEEGWVGVFVNNLYQVTMREIVTTDFGTVAWLCIRRIDSAPGHDWRHFQNIKNDLCGPETEAMEIYPAESRLVDTSNQYHLYVMPSGVQIPFGYAERDVSDVPFGKNKQRAFADAPADLNARCSEVDPETGILINSHIRAM